MSLYSQVQLPHWKAVVTQKMEVRDTEVLVSVHFKLIHHLSSRLLNLSLTPVRTKRSYIRKYFAQQQRRLSQEERRI